MIHEESLEKKFVNKWFWLYLFTFLSAPLWYVINIILSSDLTPQEFWMIYAVIGLLSIIGIFSDMGLTESLNYFLPKYILKKDYSRTKYLLLFVLIFQVFTSIVVACILYLLAPVLAMYFFHEPDIIPIIRVMCLFFLWMHITQVFSSFFWAIQNVKIQKFIEFTRSLITVIWSLILFMSDSNNVLSYCLVWVYGIYLSWIIWALIFYFFYYRTFFRVWVTFDTDLRKSFLKYSLGTLLSANVWTLLHLTDQLFITYFLWVTETWIYKIYLSLVNIPFIFAGPILAFLYPVIAELGNTGQVEKIQTIFRIFSSYISVFLLWAWGFFIITGEALAGMFFQENYLNSWEALYFIAWFLFLNWLIQINFQILSWLGHIRKRIEILTKTLIVNICLTFMAIMSYQNQIIPFPSGSSATSFAIGLSWIYLWYLSYKAIGKYGVGFDWKFFLSNLFIVIITSCICIYLWSILGMREYTWVWRWTYVLSVWFAILFCFSIFTLTNWWKIRDFFTLIKQVRSGNL